MHRAAWTVAAAIVVAHLLCSWWVAGHFDSLPPAVAAGLPTTLIAGMLACMFPALAAVILRRQPRHPVALVMFAVGATIMLDLPARWYAIAGLYVVPSGLPGATWAAWFASWNWVPEVTTLLVFVPLLFPDGRLPGPRWRIVARAAVVWIVLTTIGSALTLDELVDFPGAASPVWVPAAVPLGALILLLPVALTVVAASLVVRRRRAVGDEREQLRWLIYALGLSVAGWTATLLLNLVWGQDWGPVSAILTLGPVLLIPIAITVAITKYRLYDIDQLVNRTLVYSGLTAAVTVTYTLLVLAITVLTPARLEWRGSVLVFAVVAVASLPLREALQRVVNRRMYGDRDEPARAMSRLGRRLSDQVAPDRLLDAVAETIGHALRLPYVAVELAGVSPASAATYGHLRGEPQRLDLVHQGEAVGTLVVGRRGPGEQFSPKDLRVLQDVSRQVAAAAHAVRLARDLQASRERLVLAREEERRRLRRDLHDGLGATLAALALQAGHARRALSASPDQVGERLASIEGGIRASVVDVRRIVDDLRPPALDELGLSGALRERADSLFDDGVTVVSNTNAERLPAAVEVAAYRIGTEALTNAARHSGANGVNLSVRVDRAARELTVEVVDQGHGMPDGVNPGVGLRSMRERAAELGGRCVVESTDGGGTRVRATLPLSDLGEEVRSG